MRKLALLPFLAFAFAGCEDNADLLAPLPVSGSVQATSGVVWFTSTPPDPAVFVHTGNVGYVASADALFDNLTPQQGYLTIEFFANLDDPHTDACAVSQFQNPVLNHEEEQAQVTVFFLNPGTCIITARVTSGEHTGAEVSQTFEIIVPRGSPNAPVVPGVPPRGNPRG